MPQDSAKLEQHLETVAPGLVALLAEYTDALKAFAHAQQALTDFIADKPLIRRRFELIGEIAQTTGSQLGEDEILEILATDD